MSMYVAVSLSCVEKNKVRSKGRSGRSERGIFPSGDGQAYFIDALVAITAAFLSHLFMLGLS
jgi:hypothetical protein